MNYVVINSMRTRRCIQTLLEAQVNYFNIFRKNYTSLVPLPPPPQKVPKTSYLLFVKEIRQQMVMDNPGLSPSALLKQIAAQWTALDSTVKQKYADRWKEDYSQYSKTYASYLESLTNDQKEVLEIEEKKKMDRKIQKRVESIYKAFHVPKRPPGAYALFFKANANKRGTVSMPDYAKQIAQQWKKLSDTEKNKFKEEAEVEQKNYQEEMRKLVKKLKNLKQK